MEPINSSEKGLVCQTCGDAGFTNAFVYCVKCLKFVIHRYCLHIMPRTFHEFVNWYCEDCKSTVTSPKIKSSQSHKEEAATSRLVKAMHHKKKRKRERDVASLIAVTKEVNFREKTTGPESEFILPTNSLKEASRKSDPGRKRTAHCIRKKGGTNSGKISTYLAAMKEEHKLQNGKRTGTQKACTNMADSIKQSRNAISPTVQNLRRSQPSCERNKLTPDSSSTKKELDKTTNHECQAETGTIASQPADFEKNVRANYYRHGQPVFDPVWRGSFSIHHKDYDFFEGFVAHLSNKACEKVRNEANILPSLLHLEMHPKAILWPKSFQEYEPSDDNIALYFFPGDLINERNFDQLVLDMIDEGLAMKATAQNAELLIFTSTLLPQFLWRFQGKYYLWGVFRGRRNNSPLVENHGLAVSSNGDKCVLSKDAPNEGIHVKKTKTRVKTLDARSPRSPLTNNGENGVDISRLTDLRTQQH